MFGRARRVIVSGLRSDLASAALQLLEAFLECRIARQWHEAFADGDFELAIDASAKWHRQMLNRTERAEVCGDKRKIRRRQVHDENATAFFGAHRVAGLGRVVCVAM